MAADTKARLSLSMYDGAGGKSTLLTHAFIDSSQTIASAVAALGTLKTAALTVSNAGIKDATLTILDTSLASAPAGTASTNDGSVWDFTVSGSPNRYGLWVPSLIDSLRTGSTEIDITATVPAAFIASMLATVLGGKYTNTSYVAYNAGVRAFRAGRKLRR